MTCKLHVPCFYDATTQTYTCLCGKTKLTRAEVLNKTRETLELDAVMQLEPFNSVCASCCSRGASFAYCVLHCQPNEIGGFEPARRIGDDSSPKHHIHRKCKTCGFEWLERCLGLAPPADHADVAGR
jgi:hypothetical protein